MAAQVRKLVWKGLDLKAINSVFLSTEPALWAKSETVEQDIEQFRTVTGFRGNTHDTTVLLD